MSNRTTLEEAIRRGVRDGLIDGPRLESDLQSELNRAVDVISQYVVLAVEKFAYDAPVAYTSQRQLELAVEKPGNNLIMWGEPLPYHYDIPMYLTPSYLPYGYVVELRMQRREQPSYHVITRSRVQPHKALAEECARRWREAYTSPGWQAEIVPLYYTRSA